MKRSLLFLLRPAACALLGLPFGASLALAQFKPRPFSVGGGEEGGGASAGLTGWLLAEQSKLTHLIAGRVHALHDNPAAFWTLVGLGLLYGVFHAAGPGHGKALIASYMLANDRSLKRGAVMALLAALLQALVAIALVGAAAIIFNATAQRMNEIADAMMLASYFGIVAIGGWLVLRKGRALIAATRRYLERREALAAAPVFSGVAWSAPAPRLPTLAFQAGAPGVSALVADDCGRAHAPDPATLGDGFSWRDAAATVIAAGARPCSGSILVLIFALTQGLFAAGVAACLAIALGVAVTTGALAMLAVFAKTAAMRLAAGEDSRVALLARLFEFAAAALVLAFGLALLASARGAA
jgi:nickel/cobalt exporter